MRLLQMIMALWLAAVPLRAEVVAPDAAVEGVISSQIDAFRADDFARAFQFASPGIQRQFKTADRFGAMVMQGYPMVWRPGEVLFGALRLEEGVTWQEVLVTDAAGRRFGLAYQMEQVDGAWRIAGVMVIPAPDLAV